MNMFSGEPEHGPRAAAAGPRGRGLGRGGGGWPSEKDTKLAQKISQLQSFMAFIHTGVHGAARIFWANVASFSLSGVPVRRLRRAAHPRAAPQLRRSRPLRGLLAPPAARRAGAQHSCAQLRTAQLRSCTQHNCAQLYTTQLHTVVHSCTQHNCTQLYQVHHTVAHNTTVHSCTQHNCTQRRPPSRRTSSRCRARRPRRRSRCGVPSPEPLTTKFG